MIQQKNYNVGDFVKDKLGNEWEVLRYKEVFGLGLSMQKTDFVVCRKLEKDNTLNVTFHQDELEYVRSNAKPFIIE